MSHRLDEFMDRMRSFFSLNHEFENLSVSIGVYMEENGTDSVDVLLHKSDEAMYKAKKSGKDCYRFYDEPDS